MIQVAVWGVAYLAIGGYSNLQVLLNTNKVFLGGQQDKTNISSAFVTPQTRAVSQRGLRGVADVARDLQGVVFTSTICTVIYFKVRRRQSR